MRYKDYTAAVRYSEADETFVGRVVNVHDIIVFDGQSVAELTESFHAAIGEYLEDCAERSLASRRPADSTCGFLPRCIDHFRNAQLSRMSA